MALVKFNEGNNRALLNPFTDVFESFFNDPLLSNRTMARVPAVNISETDSEYHIELAAPGLKKEDFKVSLDRNILNISVKKKSESSQENRKYNKREYSFTSFVRSFALPDSVDDAKIEAEYFDGILNIKVAKKEEARTASRQIEIK
ncbi:Hsp20/alpha crystallin family protein [Desertivirga brevis]|uniref:Hsp20/alpha crystallin family protein n=1 Tax=Desertivirga brevis TaxID=2810310 RepID=UPI001A958B98|nr:Hsp20/alpha crystallin family protein [Pedobacter sp. SYSU D00873]